MNYKYLNTIFFTVIFTLTANAQAANHRAVAKKVQAASLDEFEEVDINVPSETHAQIDINSLKRNEWHMNADVVKTFGTLAFHREYGNSGVRAHGIFVPEHTKAGAKPIVLVLVHGTFSQEAEDYFSKDLSFYKHVLNFASTMAKEKHTYIELISFRWIGENNSAARKNGAIKLAALLTNMYAHYEKITIAHSHGCNVVNAASKALPNGINIEKIIHIAAPVRDVTELEFKPENFNILIQFYSTSDAVAAFGALTGGLQDISAGGSIRKYGAQAGKRVINVRTTVDSLEPGHANIKLIILYLNKILDVISDKYKFNSDLDLDICRDSTVKSTVLVSIRRYQNAQNNHELVGAAGMTKEAIAKQIADEYTFSEGQKAIFKTRYGKTMGEKAGLFQRLFNGVGQEWRELWNPMKY